MDTNSEKSELLSVVGPKDISFGFGSGIKLDERWNDGEGAKRVQEINEFYAMGQSLKLDSVPEVVDYFIRFILTFKSNNFIFTKT